MARATLEKECWGLVGGEGEPMSVWQRMAAGGVVAKNSHPCLQLGGSEGEKGANQEWHRSLKHASLPLVTHLLTFPKQSTNWKSSTQIYEPVEVILTQTSAFHPVPSPV